jgi:hypothetical protein
MARVFKRMLHIAQTRFRDNLFNFEVVNEFLSFARSLVEFLGGNFHIVAASKCGKSKSCFGFEIEVNCGRKSFFFLISRETFTIFFFYFISFFDHFFLCNFLSTAYRATQSITISSNDDDDVGASYDNYLSQPSPVPMFNSRLCTDEKLGQ